MAFIGAKGIVIICFENILTNEDILTNILIGNLCFLPFTKPGTNIISIHFMNCLSDNLNACPWSFYPTYTIPRMYLFT